MRPLTATKPKPLVEVAGKPLLDHVLDRLRAAGVEKVVVNVHYLAAALEAHLKAKAADLEVLFARVSRRSNRPLLLTADPKATLERLIAERYPIYAEADVTVMSRDVSQDTVASDVIAAVLAHLS